MIRVTTSIARCIIYPLSDVRDVVKSRIEIASDVNLTQPCILHPQTLVEQFSTTAKEESKPHEVQFAVPEVFVGVEHRERVAGDRITVNRSSTFFSPCKDCARGTGRVGTVIARVEVVTCITLGALTKKEAPVIGACV
jgi:hypothetical protein